LIAYCYRLKSPFLLLFSLLLLLSVSGCSSSRPVSVPHSQKTPVAAGRITEFAFDEQALSLVAGRDGNLWFAGGNKIGRMTPKGVVTTFALPGPQGESADSLVAGPDGNFWFTWGNKIGRITPNGTITGFALPISVYQSYKITAGPQGDLWFIGINIPPSIGDQIVRMTPEGVFTAFRIPTFQSGPEAITAGPDGNLWFIELTQDKIVRMTPEGAFTAFPIPTGSGNPAHITTGPDGNLWFTEPSTNKIGRITPHGTITEFSTPTFPSLPEGITTGPDGNLWFAESELGLGGGALGRGQIGRITPGGTITEFSILTLVNNPVEIAAGSDGNLWFTESGSNKIGCITSGSSTKACG
jgi:streptogramin lyase